MEGNQQIALLLAGTQIPSASPLNTNQAKHLSVTMHHSWQVRETHSFDKRNLSPAARRKVLPLRPQRSAAGPRRTSQELISSKNTTQLDKLNKTAQGVNQYLLQRGDPAEPCGQCVNKIIRSTVYHLERERLEEERP